MSWSISIMLSSCRFGFQLFNRRERRGGHASEPWAKARIIEMGWLRHAVYISTGSSEYNRPL